ncbi:glycosyl hydrolase catalytic core-domain-containing protein [Podospora fimiseda]|uniref:Glycosyl hydrolase catalytic core-domain-containing protein n=1 Tax=Podospora fimiseda TaxID=252190 RepID=A0AAN6YSW7_9PEZI|nr:glycosyl hydrolase catalytic core-domain-containing protein [Podospora fimiseda]
MRLLTTATILSLFLSSSSAQTTGKNPKRGLVSTPNPDFARDDPKWTNNSSPLSWYHNFDRIPLPAYDKFPQSEFEYVPTMWGMYSDKGDDTYFLGNITQLSKSRKIFHVLTFNLPDLLFEHGGSQMEPKVAAKVWIKNILPLREEHGVKVALPTVSDPRNGWLDPFLGNCTALNKGKECEYDFVSMHSFGKFEHLKENIGKWESKFPGKPIWVTEVGYNDQDLFTTQDFYNKSIEYMENSTIVERYAWFGAFRSELSNVGPNMAMLDKVGDFTQIGAWYMGQNMTVKTIDKVNSANADVCTLENPCGGSKKSAGVKVMDEQRIWVAAGATLFGMLLLA